MHGSPVSHVRIRSGRRGRFKATNDYGVTVDVFGQETLRGALRSTNSLEGTRKGQFFDLSL